MLIRKYKPGEEPYLWQLFYNTVHHINRRDYSQTQIDAWAPADIDPSIPTSKIRSISPYVVILDGTIVAYADLQSDGFIDHFFCHHQYQGRGIGGRLLAQLESMARRRGMSELRAEISISARPFFEAKGFTVTNEQQMQLRGQTLRNFKMSKQLNAKNR